MQVISGFENITKKNSQRDNFNNNKLINVIFKMFKSVYLVL